MTPLPSPFLIFHHLSSLLVSFHECLLITFSSVLIISRYALQAAIAGARVLVLSVFYWSLWRNCYPLIFRPDSRLDRRLKQFDLMENQEVVTSAEP
jgi:hypothetical protein